MKLQEISAIADGEMLSGVIRIKTDVQCLDGSIVDVFLKKTISTKFYLTDLSTTYELLFNTNCSKPIKMADRLAFVLNNSDADFIEFRDVTSFGQDGIRMEIKDMGNLDKQIHCFAHLIEKIVAEHLQDFYKD